jgi:hypothetical protein
MDFGKLLSRSWEIVWNNKFLFVLGLLAALGSGGGSGGGNNFNFNSNDFNDFNVPGDLASQVQLFWSQYGLLVMAGVCILLLIGIVIWLISLTAQAGLIDAVDRIDDGQTSSFGEAWAAGAGKLLSLVGLSLLLAVPFLLVAVLGLGVGVGAAVSDGGGIFGLFGILVVCLACLLVPLAFFLQILYPFAQRAIVLEESGVVASLSRGWHLMRENVGDALVLIVIAIAITFIYGLLSIIVIIPAALLLLGPALAAGFITGELGAMTIVLGAGGLVCFIAFAAVVNAILITYRSTFMTLGYKHLAGMYPNKKLDLPETNEW